MMIYFIWNSQGLNVGLKNNVNEWFEEVKDKPGVNHLDVGSLGEIVAHADKHCRQDEHYGDIEGDDGFKEEGFEVVCRVSNEVQKKGWDENG